MKCSIQYVPPQCEDKDTVPISQEICKTTLKAYENIKDKHSNDCNIWKSPVTTPSQSIAMQRSPITTHHNAK